MTKLPEDYEEMLSSMVEDLDGTIQQLTTFDSTGRTSNKIVIEYNVKQQERKWHHLYHLGKEKRNEETKLSLNSITYSGD